MYHKVDIIVPTRWWVTPETFSLHLALLGEKRFVYLSDYDPLRPDHVVVTFDDAYENVARHAAPILKARGIPFEVFVIGDYTGGWNTFDRFAEPATRLCDERHLDVIVAAGGRLQWHTATHLDLSTLSPLQMAAELGVSEALRRRYGPPHFTWFSYPFGVHPAPAVTLARAAFDGAVVVDGPPSVDRHRLPRITAEETTDVLALMTAASTRLCRAVAPEASARRDRVAAAFDLLAHSAPEAVGKRCDPPGGADDAGLSRLIEIGYGLALDRAAAARRGAEERGLDGLAPAVLGPLVFAARRIRGDAAGVAAVGRDMAELDDPPTDDIKNVVRWLRERDERVLALEVLSTAVDRHGAGWAVNWRADLRREAGDLDGALADAAAAGALSPVDAIRVWLTAGFMLRDARRVEDALDAFARSVALDPADARGYAPLFWCLVDMNRLDDALQLARTLTSLFPNDVRAWVLLTHVLVKREDFEAARVPLSRAIAIDPDDASVERLAAAIGARLSSA